MFYKILGSCLKKNFIDFFKIHFNIIYVHYLEIFMLFSIHRSSAWEIWSEWIKSDHSRTFRTSDYHSKHLMKFSTVAIIVCNFFLLLFFSGVWWSIYVMIWLWRTSSLRLLRTFLCFRQQILTWVWHTPRYMRTSFLCSPASIKFYFRTLSRAKKKFFFW